MIIQNSNITATPVNFRAKYFYSDDLYKTVQYAVEHGKFDKVNQARKNTEMSNLVKRLVLDVKTLDDGRAVVRFTRMVPRKWAPVPYSPKDYRVDKTTTYISKKKINPWKFALKEIIKLGNNAPKNKMFKEVVDAK